jgi:DNA-binding MarR family transcriptional regulator
MTDDFEPASPQDELLSSIGYLLVQTGRESRRRWVRMLSRHSLTQHQFGILMALTQLGAASQRRLSQTIGLDPRNAVAAFDGLETRGLIDRRTDTEDRRSRQVALTAEGRALTAVLTEAGERIEAELLAPLSPEEQTALRSVLLKLHLSFTPA